MIQLFNGKRSTSNRPKMPAVLAALLVLPCTMAILSGCGGGSGTGAATPSKAAGGALAVTIKWPAPGRLVPAGSSSILAVLTTPTGAHLDQQLIARPTAPPWVSTVSFSGITSPAVKLTATAFPNLDGTGTAQATGNVPASITPNQVANVTLTMGSTITHLTITPVSAKVNVGGTAALTVTAYDAANSIVLMTPNKINWSSNHPEYATVDGAGIVSGVATGIPVITATDTESSVSTTKSVSVVVPSAIHGPNYSVTSSNGKYLYVTRGLSRDLVAYSIGAGGNLTQTAAPAVSLNSKYPFGMWTADGAGGSYLYVLAADSANQSAVSNTVVFQYTIQADGSLAAMSTASVPAGSTPHALIGDSAGKYLYDIDENIGVRCFTIGSTGALTQNGVDYSLATLGPSGACGISPDGKTLYLGTYGGLLIYNAIQPDGTLVYLNSRGAYIGESITVDPVAPYLYLDSDGAIVPYTIQANYSLNQNGNYVPFANITKASAITPDGKYFYAVGIVSPNNVVGQFNVASDGTISPMAPATVAAGTFTSSIRISRNGQFVYVTNQNDDTISQFSIGASGALSPLSPPTVGG